MTNLFWPIILQIVALVEGFLDFLASGSVEWTKAIDGQWQLVSLDYGLTNKGNLILADLATIIHNVLDFVAQFTTLLPAGNDALIQNTPLP